MKVVKRFLVLEEKELPSETVNALISTAKYRAERDNEFAALRWHEQLEEIYTQLVGNFYDMNSNIQDWYIDCSEEEAHSDFVKGWQCPICGKVYSPTVKMCLCGKCETGYAKNNVNGTDSTKVQIDGKIILSGAKNET